MHWLLVDRAAKVLVFWTGYYVLNVKTSLAAVSVAGLFLIVNNVYDDTV